MNKRNDPCWKGYQMVGTKKKNGREVPNCVPEELDVELEEELTSKTIKPTTDKVKIARVIADMLGVEDPETMSPDVAVNTGLRAVQKKRLTPELKQIVVKMLDQARQAGIHVEDGLAKRFMSEQRRTIMTLADYIDWAQQQEQPIPTIPEVDPMEVDPTEVGHAIHPHAGKGEENRDDHIRRMKVKYKTEQTLPGDEDPEEIPPVALPAAQIAPKKTLASADYKTTKSGKKYRAHRIVFEQEEWEEDYELSDQTLESMAKQVSEPEDVLHLYGDDELTVVDTDTDEEILSHVKEDNQLFEVMSRAERIQARIRFLRSAPKRERRMQLALRRHSDVKTLNKRARRLAIAMLKQKIAKKPASELTVAEKERIERILATRKSMVDRLAMKLVPRVRKIEQERLSHAAVTEKK